MAFLFLLLIWVLHILAKCQNCERSVLDRQQGADFAQLAAQAVDAAPIDALARLGRVYWALVFFIKRDVLQSIIGLRWPQLGRLGQLVAGAADGVAMVIQQLADAADHQDLMVLVIAPIAASFDGLELGKFLLPIAQHMRLNATQIAHLTDGEVALRRNFWQFGQDLDAVMKLQFNANEKSAQSLQ